MKQLHLGKFFIILLLFTLEIFSSVVSAKLSRTTISNGEDVKLTIEVNGDSVEFPTINLPNAQVVESGTSSTLIYINGNLSRKKRKSYIIESSKDLTIPPLDVKVDGKVYKTNQLKLKVLNSSSSNKEKPYILEMSFDKNRTKVGEALELRLTLKIKEDAKADRVDIIPPLLDDFWVKGNPVKEEYSDGVYSIVKYTFNIFAQKSGTLNIPKTSVRIGTTSNSRGFNDPFFGASPFEKLRWRRYYSNSLKLTVDPLPNGLELYGHFYITLNVPKKEVKSNEPLNITIKVEGDGNLDDIKKFKLNIPNVMVYENDPKVVAKFKNGVYKGQLKEKIAIVADSDYTIPKIELKYFDNREQKEVTISTNPVDIKVIGTPQYKANSADNNAPIKVEVAKSSKPLVENRKLSSNKNNYLMLIVGFILGTLTLYFINIFREKKRDKKVELPITKAIKKSKNDKELYSLLLPYAKDNEYIKDKLDRLEENIYKSAKNSINRAEIIDYFEEIIVSN